MSDSSIHSSSWSWEKTRHLLFRAGFGGRSKEIEAFYDLGAAASVEALLSGPTRELPAPSWLAEDEKISPQKIKNMDKEEKQKLQKRFRQHMRAMIGEWLKFMISTPTPADMLHERMVFFWHSHFATSSQKVQAPPFIFSQLKLFHQKAFGRFSELLHSIIRDPAMLRYLDNDKNRKGKPNENLARELMELFSLGTGHYTEKDIQEGARALTGWSIEPYQFVVRPQAHDSGTKTIFGKRGNFDGDDFANLILEQPACAEFITRKLWVYFATETPQEETIQALSRTFRDSKYDIKSLLRAIFLHPEFYSEEAMGSQIKSPVQLIVGTARTLGLTATNLEFYGRMLLMMGQVPYFPPNVKGWPGGRAWIDTSRLVTRYTFAEIVGEGKVPAEIDPRLKGDADLAHSKESTIDEEMVGMEDQESKRDFQKEKKKGKENKLARQMTLPHNLKVAFDAEKLIGQQLPAVELVHKVARLLLPIPLSESEHKNLTEKFEKALNKNPYPIALQILVGQVMLLPAYQLC